LRVLNKGDFKLLLKWRLGLRDFAAELRGLKKGTKAAGAVDGDEDGEGGEEGGEEGDDDGPTRAAKGGAATGETEADIDAALEARRVETKAKAKREKKKAREAAAKLRARKALGMDHNSFEAANDDAVFSLTAIKDKCVVRAGLPLPLHCGVAGTLTRSRPPPLSPPRP
jgi:hypothetical protein